MFKLESYVTPLLLSYVNKYINLKTEDSQYSLWQGDAAFCNLDLRLDVLEKELNLPFTIVNGHIQELRIHVPWTKLGSEPIVITINTIQCILKLHNSNETGSSNESSETELSPPFHKASEKEEVSESPPGYLQNIINRVISNISIVCNNVILKYVEDDVVLSLNIKSAEVFSVNGKWEKTFINTTPVENIIRKVINMQDLTVCLDKRDACGKIETYQDPLLYRCSTVWRIYTLYNNPHAKFPSLTRINIFCDKLDFSLTDHQLPMFIRLIKLCYALHDKAAYCYKTRKSGNESNTASSNEDLEGVDILEVNDGWSSWMLSFFPFIWSEDDMLNKESAQMESEKILQFGIFIDKASCAFKTTEAFDDPCSMSTKFTFSPFGVLHLYGCSMESVIHGKDFVNIQFGVTGFTVAGLNECICNQKEFCDNQDKELNFVKAGVPPGLDNSYNFLSSTLFDPLAPENCGRLRKYCFEKETHLAQLPEEALVKRFPAFALDYVYELQIPEEWLEKTSLITSTFLETSNWCENAVCRIAVGPFCADISSSFIHFIQKLVICANEYEYPDYNKYIHFEPDIESSYGENVKDYTAEDIICMMEYVPHCTYRLILYKPALHLSVADHQHFDVGLKFDKRKLKKKKKQYNKIGHILKSVSPLLCLEIKAESIILQLQKPFYPERVTHIATICSKPPKHLLSFCYKHISVEVSGAEAQLFKKNSVSMSGIPVLLSVDIIFRRKSLYFPQLFDSFTFVHEETNFSCTTISILISQPSLLILLCIYLSWMNKDFNFEILASFAANASDYKGNVDLVLEADGLRYCSFKDASYTTFKAVILSACIKLNSLNKSTVLLQAPESTGDIYNGECFFDNKVFEPLSEHNVWFKFFLQVSNKTSDESTIMTVHLKGATFYFEPALMSLLTMKIPDSTSISGLPSMDYEDDSTCSSTTPLASSSLSFSRSQSVMNEEKHSTIYEELKYFVIEKYNILRHLVFQIQIESFVLAFPSSSWCVCESEHKSSLQSWKNSFANKKLCSACIICTPKIILENSSEKLPFVENVDFFNSYAHISFSKEDKDEDYFPWALKIENISAYSITNNPDKEKLFFLCYPSTSSATIASTTKSSQSHLNLFVHVDTTAVNINCSAFQVQLICGCLNTLSTCFNFSSFISSWIAHFTQKTCNTSFISIDSKLAVLDSYEKKTPQNCEKLFTEPRTLNESAAQSETVIPKKKITLWIQLTLSKFELDFYGQFTGCYAKFNNESFNFQFTSEEVITSLDIQDVYSKAKVKISTMNINFFLKKAKESQWYPGPYEGIILCSQNKVCRRMTLPVNGESIIISGCHADIKTDSQPFLLFTFTCALSKSAKQKWTADLNESLKTNYSVSKYISEIDVKIRKFDVILWMSLFKAIYDAVNPLQNMFGSPKGLYKPKGIRFNNHTLPLMYMETNSVRVFVPKYEIPSLHLSEEVSDSRKRGDSYVNSEPDMLCFYLGKINLTSQVENPLSRIILNNDLYAAAVSSKTILLPGSDVEDRQYHFNICDLALFSVLGCALTQNISTGNEQSLYVHPILGENPALQWNTGVINNSRNLNDEPVPTVPLFYFQEINMAFAPAIISSIMMQSNPEAALVSGITVEISVANDVSIYLSARQIGLVGDIVDIVAPLFLPQKCTMNNFQKIYNPIVQDSGFASETSTVIHSSEIPAMVMFESHFLPTFIPFEVLITASSVSLILFSYEEDIQESCKTNECFISKDGKNNVFNSGGSSNIFNTCQNLNHGSINTSLPNLSNKSLDETNENFFSENAMMLPKLHDQKNMNNHNDKNSNSSNVPKVYPMFYISVTQPHAFMKCSPSLQKFEASCFDFYIKGCSNYCFEVNDNMQVPSTLCFKIFYLETKSGELDKNTGIPPSFCTLHLSDFYCDSSKMRFCIERPCKVSASSDLWNQCEMFIESVMKKIYLHKFSWNSETSVAVNSSDGLEYDSLFHFSVIEIHSTLILIELITLSFEKPLVLLTAINSLKTEVTLKPVEFFIKEFQSHITIKDFTLKIITNNESWSILLPLSLTVVLKCQTFPYFRMNAYFESETISLNFNFKYINLFSEILSMFLIFYEEKIKLKFDCQSRQCSKLGHSNKMENVCQQHWCDDLRKGSFHIIQACDDYSLPKVHEIVFTKAKLNLPAAMTWHYPEPRTLTKIDVSPVPFVSALADENDISEEIICCVQYWDSLHQEFVKKCDFQLSENIHSFLDFPLSDASSMEFADIWRVVMNCTKNETGQSDSLNDVTSLSPLILAACMCIDSCSDTSLVPTIQIIISCPLLKCDFSATFTDSSNLNTLAPFKVDNILNHEFMTICLETITFQCKKWSTGVKVDSNFELVCHVIEYRNLTMFPVLDRTKVDVHLNVCSSLEDIFIVELEMILQSCFVKISQSVVHTLKYALHHWKENILKSNDNYCENDMLPNYYIICNNTHEVILFGQVDSDESIILPSQHMHAYSWHSRKLKQLLHISLNCKSRWSKPFSIDECGVQKVMMVNGYFVYIKIKPLSNLQKQIIFEGSVSLFNLLDKDVNINFNVLDIEKNIEATSKNKNKSFEAKNLNNTLEIVLCKSGYISLIISPESEMFLSMNECHTDIWSQQIKISEIDQKLQLNNEQYIWVKGIKIQDLLEFRACIFFCPLFLVRNHLPDMVTKCFWNQNVASCISIPGKGCDTQLSIFPLFDKDPTFHFNNDIVDVLHLHLDEFNTELFSSYIPNLNIMDYIPKKHSTLWPYSNVRSIPESTYNSSSSAKSVKLPVIKMARSSNILAEISQKWNGLNTVLIDIKPHTLFINRLDYEIRLILSDGNEFKILPNSVSVPPSFKRYFYISIKNDNLLVSSAPIWILEDNKTRIDFENVLPIDGFLTVVIHVKNDKMFLLQLQSENYEGIHVITLLPFVQLKNNTNLDLHVLLCTTPTFSKKINFFEAFTVVNSCMDKSTHLLLWGMCDTEIMPPSPKSTSPCILNIAFCACHMTQHVWSCPLYFPLDLPDDSRYTVTLLVNFHAVPLVVTIHKRNGLLFLTISPDPYPFLLLHNHTSLCLHYGQSSRSSKETCVYEELKGTVFVPHIPAGGVSYYTFPDLQKDFPTCIDSLPKIQFGYQENKNSIILWTPPIDLNFDNQFCCIQEICYIKVCRIRKQHTINVFIDIVNRIEFVKKNEKNKIHAHIQHIPRNVICSTEAVSEVAYRKVDHYDENTEFHKSKPSMYNLWNVPVSLCLTVKAFQISFAIYDEFTNSGNFVEVLRFTTDDMFLYSRTKKSPMFIHVQEVCICFNYIQIDNQIDEEDRTIFDFPVILKPHSNTSVIPFKDNDVKFLPNQVRKAAFLTISLILEFSTDEKSLTFQDINIACKPICLFLEDALYYKILRLFQSYIPYNFHEHFCEKHSSFPSDILQISHLLVNPLRIRRINIDIREIFLTLHTSLKLYLSVENSSLKFEPFYKEDIFTNFYEVGRITVIHYLMGALFQAGWVFGALDILGNPVSFARAIKTGLVDFFRFPYYGFLNGPRCFITGLSHGASSLMYGISSGAIMCVTNLATSISRNMDFLSLDSEHLTRQEMLRQHQPVGVTEGLSQGLTGFGISLLGAIAGVVDHPIQEFISSSSPAESAKGVVSGLGKGLIGFIAKPVGGAAEFISQTGHGLLQGAGWLNQPNRKFASESISIENFPWSSLKLVCKCVNTRELGDFLLFTEAQFLDKMGYKKDKVLLLTSEFLCMFDCDDETNQTTFALSEIVCETTDTEEDTIFVNICDKPEEVHLQTSDVNDRVADYVKKNWPCNESQTLQMDSQEEMKNSNETCLIFYLKPNMKNIFLSMFNSAKKKTESKGFFLKFSNG